MSHRHQFNEERFRALWSAGAGVVEIGTEFGKSKSWATLTAQRLGLPPRIARLDRADVRRIVEDYKHGDSIRAIRSALRKVHPTLGLETVAAALHRRGIQMRPRGGRRSA